MTKEINSTSMTRLNRSVLREASQAALASKAETKNRELLDDDLAKAIAGLESKIGEAADCGCYEATVFWFFDI